ncbi:alpha/beta hydrolase [Nocardia brasiliensis]|uniref:alpha/beta hydrolase n=1 Tax=Nocardia brasiliensis TaxID=37326 RepID=UPI0004A755BD|nr:alpha/beta hydrolase [Nocardia brasiliensis]
MRAHGRADTAALAFSVVIASMIPTACGGADNPRPTAHAVPNTLREQVIHWHDCRTGPDDEVGLRLAAVGAECGEFRAPLDYADPSGPALSIAVARRTATDTAHRLGTLLVQTGGPGPSRDGVAILVDGPEGGHPATSALAERYDLVGMDPRFFGASSPLDCGWPTGAYLGIAQAAPRDRADFDRTVQTARDLAARCAPQRALLPHASTRAVARDTDLLRTLLGEPKISYLGWSWGTYLGAVYLQLFGERVDRVVLDSALDPAAPGPDLTRSAAPATAAALADWARWVSTHDGEFDWGTTEQAVLRSVAELVRAIAAQPISLGGLTITADMVPGLLLTVDDSDEYYAEFSRQVGTLRDAVRGRAADLAPGLAQKLALYAETSSIPEFGFSATVANQCADRPARDTEAYFTDIQRHRDAEPMFGALARHLTPCAMWPTAPAEPAVEIGNPHAALLIGAAGDPVAPMAGQQAMRRALPGARSLTLANAFRHGVYLFDPAACLDAAVDDYLLNGTLPAADAVCERD